LDDLRDASLREMLKFHGDFVRQFTLLEARCVNTSARSE